MTILGKSALAALAMTMLAGGAAWAQNGSFAGDARDPVTGYRCMSPFCESIVLPDTDCVCLKLNPGATNVRDLRLKCTVGRGKNERQCPVQPKYGR